MQNLRFFFLQKAPTYVLLIPALFANDYIVEFYRKSCILNFISSSYH